MGALLPRRGSAQDAPATVLVEAADATNGLPLSGAQIRIVELGRLAHGAAMGEAWFRHVPAGTYTVTARRIGYAPLDTRIVVRPLRDTVEVTLFLRPMAQELPEIIVSSATVAGFNPGLRDFARHQERGFGRFLALPDLERQGTRALANVAFERFPGVRIATSADHVATYLVTARGTETLADSGSTDRCPYVQVYLDGIHLLDPDISTIQATDLAAVEFYDGVNAPVEYRRSGSSCGVLVLWTRW